MGWMEIDLGSDRFRRAKLLGAIACSVACTWMLLTAASASADSTISGTVVDAVTKAPIDEVEVCAFGDTEEDFSCTETNSTGVYSTGTLLSDDYTVEFFAPWLGYLTQFYDGAETFGDADPVTVASTPVTGIDAELSKGGSIQGTVTDAATSAPVAGAEVCAFTADEEFGRCTETGPGGSYSVSGLISDNYYVEFWAGHLGYTTQFWNGAINFADADLVAVSGSSTVPGINAALTKPTPAPVVTPPPPPPPPAFAPKGKAKAKGKCRKGFRKKRVKGKKRCVKIKKGKRKGQRRR